MSEFVVFIHKTIAQLTIIPLYIPVRYIAVTLKWDVCLETKWSLKLDFLPANFGHLHPVIVNTSCEVAGSHPDARRWKQMQGAGLYVSCPAVTSVVHCVASSWGSWRGEATSGAARGTRNMRERGKNKQRHVEVEKNGDEHQRKETEVKRDLKNTVYTYITWSKRKHDRQSCDAVVPVDTWHLKSMCSPH